MRMYKSGSDLIFRFSDGGEFKYCFKTGKYLSPKGNVVKHPQRYFSGMSLADFEASESDASTKRFLRYVRAKHPQLRSVGSLLEVLPRHPQAEIGISMGLDFIQGYLGVDPDSYVKPWKQIPKPIVKLMLEMGEGCQENRRNLCYKSFFHPLDARFNVHSTYSPEDRRVYFDTMLKLSKHYENDRPSFFEKIRYNGVETLINLIRLKEQYNYDMNRLIYYAFEFLPNVEGAHVRISDILDYARMSSQMSRGGKFEKYPRFFLSVHQLTVMHYATFSLEHDEELFKSQVDSTLEHKGRTYSVILPEKTSDLLHEGIELQHCVKSYIQRVINGETQITLLRLNKELEKPLVTLEIKDGSIVQARGFMNRAVTEDEKKFLETYAKTKSLTYVTT